MSQATREAMMGGGAERLADRNAVLEEAAAAVASRHGRMFPVAIFVACNTIRSLKDHDRTQTADHPSSEYPVDTGREAGPLSAAYELLGQACITTIRERDALQAENDRLRAQVDEWREQAERGALAVANENLKAERAEFAKRLLELLNPLHGSIDKQTYPERIRLRGHYLAPDAVFDVNITVKQEADLESAVLLLEAVVDAAIDAKQPATPTPPVRPLVDGTVSPYKGGHNTGPSQITERPGPPGAIPQNTGNGQK